MKKFKVKEVNCETGEEIVRDATDIEIAQMEASRAKQAELDAELETRQAERQAILDRLGLTADEAQLLLGGK